MRNTNKSAFALAMVFGTFLVGFPGIVQAANTPFQHSPLTVNTKLLLDIGYTGPEAVLACEKELALYESFCKVGDVSGFCGDLLSAFHDCMN